MDLDNALPGHLVASVFEVLPIDAYLDLVHPRLRFAPDFFVFDVEARQSWLTEIKFRHYIHRALCDDLRLIQRDWAPFTLILAVAEPPREWTGIVRHIKTFTMSGHPTGARFARQCWPAFIRNASGKYLRNSARQVSSN